MYTLILTAVNEEAHWHIDLFYRFLALENGKGVFNRQMSFVWQLKTKHMNKNEIIFIEKSKKMRQFICDFMWSLCFLITQLIFLL